MWELDLKFALSASRQAGCGHSSPFTAQEADKEGMLLEVMWLKATFAGKRASASVSLQWNFPSGWYSDSLHEHLKERLLLR